jgi:hypothetical protein
MDPNFKTLKEGNEKGEGFEVEMFGIEFSIDEGSSEGFYPVKKIAERSHISVEFIEDHLKKYGLMTDNGDWSREEYSITNCDKKSKRNGTISKLRTSSIVMHHLFTTPKGKDVKDCKTDDLIDLGIYVHEYFVLQLMKKPCLTLRQLLHQAFEVGFMILKNQLILRVTRKTSLIYQ